MQANKEMRKTIYKKAAAYKKEYDQAEKRLVRLKRQVCICKLWPARSCKSRHCAVIWHVVQDARALNALNIGPMANSD
jgi:hypothetical protein